nr:ribonuclease H-like domain-containing protein [Tanacetum cinerariifolium]
VDDYTRIDFDFTADGNLSELSGEEAWEAIYSFAQGQKEWGKPFKPDYRMGWPLDTPQVIPSFKVYTSPVTYPEEVEETIGIPMEVEHLDRTKLEDLGLNTCNHDIPFSSREISSADEPEPQLFPNFSPLD